MKRSPLTSKVNFYVSICFVLSFGLYATSFILRVENLEDPITNTIESSIPDPMLQ